MFQARFDNFNELVKMPDDPMLQLPPIEVVQQQRQGHMRCIKMTCSS